MSDNVFDFTAHRARREADAMARDVETFNRVVRQRPIFAVAIAEAVLDPTQKVAEDNVDGFAAQDAGDVVELAHSCISAAYVLLARAKANGAILDDDLEYSVECARMAAEAVARGESPVPNPGSAG